MPTVLIIDDTISQLELINCYLQESGYMAIKAVDPKDGFEKAMIYQPDVIITDVVMPGMSGFELCRKLKREPKTQKSHIIICSSKNGEIDRIWGMRQGASAYLTKPFTKQDLLRTLRLIGF